MLLPPEYLRNYGGSGPPLVLIGEILAGGASWSAHADRLSERWAVHVVTPLLVTYAAQAALPPKEWGIAMESQALATALNGAGVGQVHLTGWSMGGAIALDFALTFPDRTLSLTLIEPQVRWLLRAHGLLEAQGQANSEQFRAFAERPITEDVLSKFLRLVGAVGENEDPRESRAWRLAWTNRMAIASAWRVTAHEDTISRLEQLQAPLLLVRGDHARPLDLAMVEQLAKLRPHARTVVLPGGHSSHITAIDTFIQELEAFLATC